MSKREGISMNRRAIAIVLVGALAISMLSGCKSETDEFEIGSSAEMGGNDFATDDSSSENQQNQNTAGDNSAGTNGPNQNAGGEQNDSAAGNQSGNQSSKPDAEQPSGQGGGSNQGGNQSSSSAGLKETFGGSDPISVAAGETVWYGPASTAQKEQLTFTDSNGKVTTVTTDQLQKISTFGNGYVIYAYKAASAGKVTLQVPNAYADLFLASKETMDINAYYGYWDNIKDRNLYHADLDKSSKRIGVDGKTKDSNQGGAMHAIPVKAGDTLTIAPVSASTLVQGCGYDAKMNAVDIISGYGMKEAFVFPQGKRGYTYKVPEGVAFVRFNVPAEEADTFVVMKNKEFDLSYYSRTTKVNPDQVEDPLYKKQCLYVGDSLCSASQDTKIDGQRGWARRVKELTGSISTNAGRGGSAFSDCRMYKSEATEYHQIHKQITRFPGVDYDYILLEGGGNDAWESAPIGKPTKDYDPTFFDLTTYAGGLEMAIYTAITEYGDTAAIGYLITYKMPRNKHGVVATKLGDYFEVGKQICDKWNITYFDMYNHTEIYNKLKPESTEHVPDGTHADDSGYDIIGPYITDYMRSMTPVTQKIRDELAAIG